MPDDIAGGSYVPDMPIDGPVFDDIGAFLESLAEEGARPSGPSKAPPPETRGPMGVEFERNPHDPYLDPPDAPDWMRADPNWRQAPIDNRTMQGLEKNFIPGIQPHSREARAILKVLDMRNAGRSRGFDDDGYKLMPVESSPMAEQLGMKELRNPALTLDPARDRYLGMIQVAERLGIPGSIPDKRVIPTKQPTAEELVQAIFDANKPNVPDAPVQRLPGSPGGKSLNEQIEEGSILDDDD